MKKLIAILCALCMIATMMPISVMADGEAVEPVTTLLWSWSGEGSEDALSYDAASKDSSGAITLVPTDNKNPGGYSYLNEGIGGKAADDYYTRYDYNETYKNYLLYWMTAEDTEVSSNYLTFKYNVFGNEGALYLQTRLSSTAKPILYKISEAEKKLLNAGVWNSCMIVLDISNNTAWGYINGSKTHVADNTEALLAINEAYTSLSDINLDRFMLYAHSYTGTEKWLNVDDLSVVMSTEEPVTPTASVTSDAVISGNTIVAASGSVANLASEGNTVIVYDGTAAVRSSATAAAGNIVSVEYTDAAYGKLYQNYAVKTTATDKFWDGSAEPNIADHGILAANMNDMTYEANSVGGKEPGDSYLKFTSVVSGDSMLYTNGKNTSATRYNALSINVFGKAVNNLYSRYDSPVKPGLTGTISGFQYDNRWNNIFVVYDSVTKDIKTYINGELKVTKNLYTICADELKGTVDKTTDKVTVGEKTYSINFTDVRIKFVNSTSSAVKTWYADDFAIMNSDVEPVPYGYVSTVTVNGDTETDGIVVLPEGATSAEITAKGASVMVYDGTAWRQTSTVEVGDEIMLITHSPYGNIYPVSYMGVADASNKQVLATMNDGMSFVQGGRPWVADENGTVANEDGTMGKNITVTGADCKELLTDVEDIYGSKYTMQELTVGYNFMGSTQTYYQTSWKKTDIEAQAKYLVFEADFAFASADSVNGFGLSTNGGSAIGTGIGYKAEYANRVNHYLWVYDIQAGTYVDYLNGVALVDEPTAVVGKFATGESTAIRFTANGTTKMTSAKTEKLDEQGNVVTDADGNAVMVDLIGTYEGGLKGYVQNLQLSSASTAPEVKQAPALEGAVAGCYPVYDTSALTVDYIKNTLVNDATVNTYVYTNKAYTTELTDGSAAVDFYYVIVTEKDGMYGYYPVCKLPEADASYAIDTLTQNGTERYVSIVNITDARNMTVIITEKDADGKLVKCDFAVEANVAKGGIIDIGLEDVAEGNTTAIHVWDSFATMKPLGGTIVQ